MPDESLPARTPSMSRIPSIDGLRALSIFLVLALHTLQHFGISHHVSFMWYAIFDGGTGVYIFFVISGYLITSLLLNEQQKRGSVSMRGFYLRRAMRILPPLYVYVAVIALLGWAGRLVLDRIDILSSLFFVRNYVSSSMWSLEHFWSLSTEEQFYLIWPTILLLYLRKHGLAGRLAAGKFALVVILVSPFVRVFCYRYATNQYVHDPYGFHMNADCLMFGCIVALLQGTPHFERLYAFATKIWWIPPAVILLSDTLSARFQNYWQMPFGFTFCGAGIAFFLLWCVRNPTSIVGRILNARPVVHIGHLSYSIYLWQTLFLHYLNVTVFGSSLKFLTIFPISWLAILCVAEMSFYLVEQPSLRLRGRLIRAFHLYTARRQALATGTR
jgi:peptidoglycan/LPS O-acetylase OafA/YrhL